MTRNCVFCGKELGIFERDALACGGVLQPTCKNCYMPVIDMDMVQRTEKALATGRAIEPETLRTYLQKQAERAVKQAEEERQRFFTGLNCQRCGGPMLNLGRQNFNMGEEGLFGLVARDGLMASFLELDMLACQNCGKVEFFRPGHIDTKRTAEKTQAQTEQPADHSAGQEQEHWSAGTGAEQRKTYRKPPWEK